MLGAILICIVSVLIVYFIMIALGLVQTSRNHILITTESAEKLYDGEPLTAEGWELVDGELLAGHTMEAEVLGSQTMVGESDNIISVAIFDSEGADVTSTYEIEYQLGTLSVKGKKLEFTTGAAGKYYDGTPLSCPDWTFVGGELMENHEYTAYTIGQITNIGSAPNAISVSVVNVMTGEDVTKYYSIECNEGELVVSARRLVVSLGASGTLSAEGGDISTDGVIISGNLLPGHRAIYEPLNTNYGGMDIESVFVRVLDENGNDVTEYYEIIYPMGDLTIENANTYLPQKMGDLLNTSEYKQLFEESYGNINNESGIDINGDGIPDLKMDENGNIDVDGDGVPDMTVDENGMLDIDGDGVGDIPAALGALAVIECYRITSDTTGYVYLREKSYGDYDGNDWKSPALYSGVSPYLFSAAALQNADVSNTATLKVTPLFNNLKYVLPYYYTGGIDATNGMNDCYTDTTAEANFTYEVTYLPYDFKYSDGYRVPDYLADLENEYFLYVLANYLGVNESTKASLLEIAAMEGLDPTDPEIIEKVAEYIRGAATYNLDFADFPEDTDNIIYFLTEGKEGVCRHFAAAATLMYRSLGIPARYVTGFASAVVAGEETSVYALQAHAWVEVYISGFGWAQIEVTPGSSDGSDEGGGDGGGSGSGGMAGSTVGGENPMGGGDGSDGEGTVVMQVASPNKGALYMRSHSYGDYDGRNWNMPENELPSILNINPFTFTSSALAKTNSGINKLGETRNVMITMIAEQYPYMLPYYTSEAYIPDGAETDDNRVLANMKAGDYIVISYTYYDYLSSDILSVSSELAMYESIYGEYAHKTYTGVAEDTARGLRAYAEKYGITGDEENLVELIAECVREAAKYSLSAPEVPEGEDGVLYFLNTSKLGKCSHFATAATLMYRAFDIPARYTVGYMVDIQNTSTVDVTDKNAHAWVEVYIDGIGWVRMEVTPAAEPDVENMKFDITVVTTSYSVNYYEIRNEADNYRFYGSELTSIVWTGSGGFASRSTNKGWTRTVDDNGRAMWVCSNEYQEGHHFYEDEVTITGSKDKSVGSVANAYSLKVYDKDGKDVTSRYTKKYTGYLTVKPIEVTITTHTASFEYEDGKGVWYNKETVTYGEGSSLIDGHRIEIDYTYTEENPMEWAGTVDNSYEEVRIMEKTVDNNGNEVWVDVAEKYYEIKYVYGTLTAE